MRAARYDRPPFLGGIKMTCMQNCQLCKNLIVSTAAAIGSSALTITIPATVLNDNDKKCLVIAQSFTASTPLPAIIADGSATIALTNRCGKPVYSDQLRTRRIYKIRLNTAVPSAVVESCNLCPTSFTAPQITGATT